MLGCLVVHHGVANNVTKRKPGLSVEKGGKLLDVHASDNACARFLSSCY